MKTIEQTIKTKLKSLLKIAGTKCEKDVIEVLIHALSDSTDLFIYRLWFNEKLIKTFLAKHKIVIPQKHLDYLVKIANNMDESYLQPSQKINLVILMMNHDCECYHNNTEGFYQQFLNGELKKLVP